MILILVSILSTNKLPRLLMDAMECLLDHIMNCRTTSLIWSPLVRTLVMCSTGFLKNPSRNKLGVGCRFGRSTS